MNAALKITERALSMQAQLETLRDGLAELRSYLTSDKFSGETAVQVRDVLRRLREIEDAAEVAGL